MSTTPPPSTASGRIRHVIEPRRSWLRIDWSELAEYRDLIFLLYRRDYVSRYKQTILGPLWYILQPLATALIFSVVFGRFVQVPTEGVPRILFYLAGLLAWNFCTQNLYSAASTFSTNAELFGKVYFPRLVVPIAGLMSNLLNVAVQFGIFLMFYALHRASGTDADFGMTAAVVLIPLLLLHIAAFGLGLGLWFATLTGTYRDLKYAMGFIITSLMYLTPVIYPLSAVPDSFRFAIQLNPMTSIVEGVRFSLLGVGTVEPAGVLASVGVTLVILLSGVAAFQRTARTVVDTV